MIHLIKTDCTLTRLTVSYLFKFLFLFHSSIYQIELPVVINKKCVIKLRKKYISVLISLISVLYDFFFFLFPEWGRV